MAEAQPLTEVEQAVLALERAWFRRPGAKAQRIRDELGMPATRYYQLLNALIDRPEALAADPVTVGRLRRLRDLRTGRRR
jgi:hypothetical protein